ncbi:hypothetical protein SHY81_18215 [Bacillus velezensis]|uniref:hypothetical protein n=1 Tax=Bacillus velezensis TaxID=492670 RepID=UPI000F8F7354|nr:hypothetical protein [Bacillus velezensis]RUR97308.1 hypothetical protein EFW57_02813 [Bacillus velezensis]
MNVSELVIFPDLLKLPKSDLEDICTNEGIAESGGAFKLAKRIWDYADTSEKKQRMFTPYCHKFFAGNTSISWYTCDSLEDLSKHIIEKERHNPFETKIPYEEAKLNTTPKLRSASRINEHSYFLRFIYKDGTRRIIGEDIEVLPTNKTATAFIDELNGIIEVRAKPNDAEKIAEVIAGYARQQLSLHKQNFIKPFGGSIESIADTLGGKLYESKASPELWMDNFGEEENEALLDIFEALSKYFENGDIDKLQECLDNAKEILGGELLSLPFAVLVLAGMGNVGLKVEQKDLRNTTLYKVFKPYLQTSGGYIKFEVEENGVQHEFSMVVGVESQSIYFRSKKTTETVIKKVREKLLLQNLVV